MEEDLSIPDYLKISQEERKAAWLNRPLTGRLSDEKISRRRELEIELRKQKNAKALARLKSEHVGERYDRKNKRWVKDYDRPEHSSP